MRSVSVRARGATLLLFLVLVTAVPAVADELPSGMEPPQGRIAPPVGVASDEPPSVWELFLIWLEGRIQPPVG